MRFLCLWFSSVQTYLSVLPEMKKCKKSRHRLCFALQIGTSSHEPSGWQQKTRVCMNKSHCRFFRGPNIVALFENDITLDQVGSARSIKLERDLTRFEVWVICEC